jgi:hypothetical protein
MTLALASQPRPRHGKMRAENVTRGSHLHSRECKRVRGNEPKLSQMDSHFGSYSPKCLKSNFKGQHSLDWKVPYTIGKILRHRYLKWALMIHLSIYNTNYGKKKGWESKCQFDSWPLKVRNRLEIRDYKCHITYPWKVLEKGYNFSLNLTSIGGLHKKLWASKVARVSILGFFRHWTWKSLEKWHLGVAPMGNHTEYYKEEGGGFPKFGPWWVLWVHVCPWLTRAPKVLQLDTILLGFSLCKSRWIIDSLVICPNPHPIDITHLFYPRIATS